MLELLRLSINFPSKKKKKKAQLNVTNQRWNPALFFFLQLSWVAIHKENHLLNLQATARSLQDQWQALLDSLDLHLKKSQAAALFNTLYTSFSFLSLSLKPFFLFQNKDVAQIEAALSDLSMRHSPDEKSYAPVLQVHNI